MIYDLMIIGGGASGLAAAVTALSMGIQKVGILERLPRIGKKILATGNGRCNLSHAGISASDYQGSYNPESVLSEFGDVSAFFENLGLYCRTDDQGRMYPYSMTANAVLDALRLHCTDAEELCNQNVIDLYQQNNLWHLRTEGRQYSAKYVIFSGGGFAAPKFGTDGSAWKLLQKLNIPVINPKPILCPILSDRNLLFSLKGLRVKGSVSLLRNQKIISTETGEIQFTEQALSGICIFNLSALLNSQKQEISVNLFPELGSQEVLARLYTCCAVRSESDCENMLSGLMHKTLAKSLLKRLNIHADMSCSQLSDLQLRQIAELCQDVRFPVKGTADFSQAQATAGGVHGNALDEHLQVKNNSGLYVTGEAVDIHAPCGGYQLHWAWASGYNAGKHIAERILS